MQWIELTIKTACSGIELLEAALTVNGFDSFIVDDEEEFHSFLANNRDYWDIVDEELENSLHGVSQLRLYLADDAAAREELARLRQLLDELKQQDADGLLGSLALSCENVRNEDWENNWKQYYQPIPIGERLLVVPKWLAQDCKTDRIRVLLDPGMIFGTGAHASTRMCMQMLEREIHGAERVLDLGSGSGILSITALLLGAKSAIGVDVDPKAEDIARENAACNGLYADRFTAVTGNILKEQEKLQSLLCTQYDILCLNIFADVIIPMAAVLPQLMMPSSVLICSGILETRLQEVQAALTAAGLQLQPAQIAEDWCCIKAKRGK